MFVKGVSGNPSGRPKNGLREFLLKKKGLPNDIYKAVYPLLKSKKESNRIWAAEYLRDSTWGKPAQDLNVSGDLVIDRVDETVITKLVEARVKEISDSSSKR